MMNVVTRFTTVLFHLVEIKRRKNVLQPPKRSRANFELIEIFNLDGEWPDGDPTVTIVTREWAVVKMFSRSEFIVPP